MIEKYDKLKAKFSELKTEFLEMGRLKSDFDIEKFTVKKEGNFIAHNYHFLLRQYSLAMYEAKRMYLDKEEKVRLIKDLTDKKEKNWDIEVFRAENEIDMLDLNLRNKIGMLDHFEVCRVKLIELNDGVAPTDKQYQDEEPAYWQWYLEKKAVHQLRERQTGVTEGVWENIHYLEEKALINKNFEIDMLGENNNINFLEADRNIQGRLERSDRLEKLDTLTEAHDNRIQ